MRSAIKEAFQQVLVGTAPRRYDCNKRNAEKGRSGSLAVLLLAERARRRGMEADDLLCSRNARPQKALVGRAQWKINQPPSLKR
jgi:hypothetical protein